MAWRRLMAGLGARGSLRRKLVLACVGVQLAATALLVSSGLRQLQDTLLAQARFEAHQVLGLLAHTVAAPLAQRDYATLQQTLDGVRHDAAMRYLVLHDHRGRVVAASGWDPGQLLPPRDDGRIDLERADSTLHLGESVALAGQSLGRVEIGLSTERLRTARREFLWHSLAVGALALLASVGLLWALAHAVTRQLARLDLASQRVAAGDLDAQVPVNGADEIGRLGASFNAMALALKARLMALQASELRQQQSLAVAQEERARLATLLGTLQGGIVFVDAGGRVVYVNEAFARLWSLPAIGPGQALADWLPAMAERLEAADAAQLRALKHAAPVAVPAPGAAIELRMRDGRTIVQRVQPVVDGAAAGWVCLHDDVTEERRNQQRARLALIDPLTALLNRRGLLEALARVLAEAGSAQQPACLLFIDLDDFKHANDMAGHHTGDEILLAASHAMQAQLRPGDMVARLGGDEFAVLCPGMTAEPAGRLAARLVDAVAALQVEAAGTAIRIGCSVGVAVFPDDARQAEDLLACADQAMLMAKRGGKNTWSAWRHDPQRAQAEAARVRWNRSIQRALQEQRFVLHYQPVHRCQDLGLAHHEALVRMVAEDDRTRLIEPGEFIHHAERSGKIQALDRWVFASCVRRLADTDAATHIAANLSARSLEDAGFPAFLQAELRSHGVDPGRLHIELTETSAIRDPLVARRLIDALRSLGCAVHLDDFGTGFSSFARLKLLDVDAIKVDGSFIRQLRHDQSNQLFVAAMIDVAHQLRKTVVAEHVEDRETLELLRGLGIDLVQGYHLGRPSARLADAPQRLHLAARDGRLTWAPRRPAPPG